MATGENLIHQIVDLVLTGTDFYLRIQQTRRTDHLFYYHALSLCQFKVGRGGTDVNNLVHHLLELLEPEWTVVEGGRQAESVFHQVALTTAVTSIHGIQLGHRHVALINEEDIIVREEVEKAVRAFTRFPSVEIAAVVLDTRAVSQLLNHLHIVFHTLFDALGFHGVACLLEEGNLLHEIVLYLADGDVGLFL